MTRRRYDSGPPCATCGMYAINVVHDDEETRRRNIETWAFASPGMGGQDYYTWAGVVYHPFVPMGPRGEPPVMPYRTRLDPPKDPDAEAVRQAYERGYQAGYHARIRSGQPR